MKFLLALLVLGSLASLALAGQPPNILFILTDQHHARMLSRAGNPYLKTGPSTDGEAGVASRTPTSPPGPASPAASPWPPEDGGGTFRRVHHGMKATITKEDAANSMGNLIQGGGYATFWIYCRLTERVAPRSVNSSTASENTAWRRTPSSFSPATDGDMDGSHRLASKNVFYENSVGVPFIMQFKGVIPPGVVDDACLISNGLDVLPTLCDFAGVPTPAHLLGRTLRPLAEGRGDNARRPYIVAENTTGRMLRTARYKYRVYGSGNIRESLVDLRKDPGEMRNLAVRPRTPGGAQSTSRLSPEMDRRIQRHEARAFAIAPER